jgi:hypothetical protein
MLDGVPSHAQFACPLGDCQALAVPLNPMRQPSIAILLERIGPSAILGRIALAVVDAINGVTRRRARPHVFVKPCEGLTPSRGHCQTESAVTGKRRRSWIAASLNDVRPDVVFAASIHAVFAICSLNDFLRQASTRLLAPFQVVRAHMKRLAALAATQPPDRLGFPRWAGHSFDNEQAPKRLSGSVNDAASHISNIVSLSG